MALFGLIGSKNTTRVVTEETKPQESQAQNDYREFVDSLRSSHKLRRLFDREERNTEFRYRSNSDSAAAFFMILGAYQNNQSSEARLTDQVNILVTLAWEYEGAHIITKIPLNKVRIKIVEDKEREPEAQIFLRSDPHINRSGLFSDGSDGGVRDWHFEDLLRGNWYFMSHDFNNNQQNFLDRNLAHVVITCREEDWPKKISMPFNSAETEATAA